MRIYLYIGIALPPGVKKSQLRRKKDLHSNDFLFEDVLKLDLSGLVHLYNHDPSKPVGRVLASFNGNDGSKMVIGAIDMDSFWGNYLVFQIENGQFNELSLQHFYYLEKIGPDLFWEEKRNFEISSVEKANRPGCRIIAGYTLLSSIKRYIFLMDA